MPKKSISQIIKNRRSERPRTYFQLIQRVGSDGKYQFYMLLIFILNWFAFGTLLMNNSFIFYNRQFQCQRTGLLASQCQNLICELPIHQRKKYIKNQIHFQSIATQMGQYYCQDAQYLDWAQSAPYLGLFVGYLIFSYYSDKYGRRKSMIFALLIAVFGNFIVSISINLLMAVIGLFLAGVGGNSSMTIVFYFLTQTVSNSKRQKYGVLIQSFLPIGVIVIATAYLIFQHWRVVNILFILIPNIVCLVVSFILLEQTPQFLLKKSNKQAVKALNKIGKINYKIKDILEQEDILSVKQAQISTKQFNEIVLKPYDLIRYSSLRHTSVCSCLIFFICYAMYDGSVIVINRVGFNIYLGTYLVQLSELITILPIFFFIQKINRKHAALIAFTITFISSTIIIFLKQPRKCDNCAEKIVQLVFIFIFRCSIVFYFCIFYLYITQLFPLRITGLGTGVASAFGSIAALFGPIVFRGLQKYQFNQMTIYSVLSLIALGLSQLIEQTKGIPLKTQVEQIKMLKQSYKSTMSVKKSFSLHSIIKNSIRQDQQINFSNFGSFA